MALSNNYADIAIKAFLGLLHTDTAKGINNEADTVKMNFQPDEVWIDLYGKTRTQALSLGLIENVNCELEVDNTSNDHTFKLKLPSGYSGDLGNAGDIMTSIVNQRYGSDYVGVLRAAGDVVIPLLDAREWLLNFTRIYQDDTSGSTPVKFQCDIYKGKTLADYLFPTHETLTDGATVTMDTKGQPMAHYEWDAATSATALVISNERTDGKITYINATIEKTIAGDVVVTIPTTHTDTDTVVNKVIGDADYDSGAGTITFSGDANIEFEIAVKIWKTGATHKRIYTVANLD